jgi:D-threo-aldose 1-dehydrogenase
MEMVAVRPTEWIRELGSTGIPVSAICVGPRVGVPAKFGQVAEPSEGANFVEALIGSDIRFLNTSNSYSGGASESQIGVGIAQADGLPDDFLVATKVDAKAGDYSGARVLESLRESKERLGLAKLPLVYLHDPEYHDFDALTESGGAIDTLVRLRDAGEIGHIGVAGGDVRIITKYVGLGVFEVLLTHSRWTLVDHSAGDLIAQASDAGLGIVNAAIYGGGLLANPHGGSTRYGYRPATDRTLKVVASMADVCDRWGTDLPTAALQASLRDRRIHSTVIGASRISRIAEIMSAANTQLPGEFWAEIGALMPSSDYWLDKDSIS